VLAFHPETVSLGALPPLPEPLPYTAYGILDLPSIVGQPSEGFAVARPYDPRTATPEKGQSDVAAEARSIAKKARDALASLGIAVS
jgi:hypothetical protein